MSELSKALSGLQSRCEWCGAQGDSQTILKCGGCKLFCYCSVGCQKEDWRHRHRYICATHKTAASDKKFASLPPAVRLELLTARLLLSACRYVRVYSRRGREEAGIERIWWRCVLVCVSTSRAGMASSSVLYASYLTLAVINRLCDCLCRRRYATIYPRWRAGGWIRFTSKCLCVCVSLVIWCWC
jgi:hypothetical protein